MENSSIKIEIIPVTPFEQNCTMMWDNETKEGVFIDAGGEAERLIECAKDNGVNIKAIWLTHGHLDHAGGAAQVARELNIPIIGPHKDDKWLLDSIPEAWARYGYHNISEACSPDKWLKDGDVLHFSNYVFEVVHCPGHTPGHVAFINRELKLAFVGDLIFKGSIGRTDFPRGNNDDLINSITQKLWPFGDDIRFIPGHREMSSFGAEKLNNPYVSDAALKRR